MWTHPEILAAIIMASGSILAAVIGGLSVLMVALHRKAVINVARSVETYYALETEYVKLLMRSEKALQPLQKIKSATEKEK